MLDLIFVGLLQAAAGEPQTAPPTEQPQQTQAEPGLQSAESDAAAQAEADRQNRVVCRSTVRTGTRMPTRRCLTQRERELNRQADQDSLNDAIRQGTAIRPSN